MSRKKLKFPEDPEKFIEDYKKIKNMTKLAKMYKVSAGLIKIRLVELGVLEGKLKGKKIKLHYKKREFSKEFLERRKLNTKINNEYFKKTNAEGKRYNSSSYF